jgi:hypothetical protein
VSAQIIDFVQRRAAPAEATAATPGVSPVRTKGRRRSRYGAPEERDAKQEAARARINAARMAYGLDPVDRPPPRPWRNAANPLRQHLHTLRTAVTDANKLAHAVDDEEIASVRKGVESARHVAEQLVLVLSKWTGAPS